MNQRLYDHLLILYGPERAGILAEKLLNKLAEFEKRGGASRPSPPQRVSEKDAILITYGDMVQAIGERPLSTLAQFLQQYLPDVVNAVHILPFFPYSSDDGFSVIDYTAVNPEWGDWEDIARIGDQFRLMFDAVVNHISAESSWFKAFLRDQQPYRDYFTVVAPGTDVSAVFRPRTHPVLTPFKTPSGTKLVWTTFSADQIDLNFANPEVLFEVIDILLFYVLKEAEFIRLDAIAYIWKEQGTSCLHLPQTHEIIKLMRTILDRVAPQVSLITETNVPHQENISYFGNGRDEAQLVYNFSLPPLTLHAFHTGNAAVLSHWASTLSLPSTEVTFFNFLASHDGIGLQPVRGLLTDTAVTDMAQRIEALGGFVSYKTNSDNSQSPYELNCNYLDALADPNQPEEPQTIITARFMAAQAIMLSLKGVPGIYFHSLLGSRNWHEGVQRTGQRRSINRQKINKIKLLSELADDQSLRHHVFQRYKALLQIRRQEAAFQPQGEQEVIFCHEAIFALKRRSVNGRETILCLQNVSKQAHLIRLNLNGTYQDLLSGHTFQTTKNQIEIQLKPYAILWLKKVIS